MAKPEWGAKHSCKSCGKVFYDMLRDPILCPGCGTKYVPEKILKPAKAAPAAKAKVKAPVAVVSEDVAEASSLLLDDEEILKQVDADLPDDVEEDDELAGVVVPPVESEGLS